MLGTSSCGRQLREVGGADHPIKCIEELLPWKVAASSTTPQPRGGLNEDAATNAPTGGLPDFPYIEETIEQGGISIGVIPPLTECVAVAHEGRNTLAMLKRRTGESLAQLLSRLDLAIARAHTDDIFTDEINPPAKSQRP